MLRAMSTEQATRRLKGEPDQRHHILLVASTENFRSTVSRILSRCGYCVCTVNDAEAALEQLRRDSYDLVVSESYLPGISGLNLLFQMRDRGCTTPVVLVAESLTERFRWIVSGMGEVHCLRSPVDLDDLKGLLAACLSQGRTTARNGQMERNLTDTER